MNLRSILAVCVLGGMLAGCDPSSMVDMPPVPTPMSEPIAVVSRYHLPAKYTVVGTVTGFTIDMLKDKARKLGADAIINPRKVDPVSGWATTEAIKVREVVVYSTLAAARLHSGAPYEIPLRLCFDFGFFGHCPRVGRSPDHEEP